LQRSSLSTNVPSQSKITHLIIVWARISDESLVICPEKANLSRQRSRYFSFFSVSNFFDRHSVFIPVRRKGHARGSDQEDGMTDWSQFKGLPGLLALWGNKASYKAPARREVQEACSDSVWFDAPETHDEWLSGEAGKEVLRPFPAQKMKAWRVSARVNKPENDDPGLLEAGAMEQIGLLI
jgi:hypothetical protein